MFYFDWSASCPISETSLKEYVQISKTFFANPSSNHDEGHKAASYLNKMRNEAASLFNTKADNIFFTSGGTESNAVILNSLLNKPFKGQIICSAIEHPAIGEYKTLFTAKGWDFKTISCPNGYINLNKLEQTLCPETKMVCIMAVNNVTGTIQPIKKAVSIIRNYSQKVGRKIHIHCDAVQAISKINFYPEDLDIDSFSASAHKFYGPKGVGLLYNKDQTVLALSKGGGQESGLRPGTENLAGIGAMICALKDELSNIKENTATVEKYRNYIEKSLIDNGFKMISPSMSSDLEYIQNIICVSASPIPSEVILRLMSDKGFCLSSSSACSASSKAKAERILTAMDIDPVLRMSALRISLSHLNTQIEVESLVNLLIKTRKELCNE